MGSPDWKENVLQLVPSLMLVLDFDLGVMAVTLKDGRIKSWGVGRRATQPRFELHLEAYDTGDMPMQAGRRSCRR